MASRSPLTGGALFWIISALFYRTTLEASAHSAWVPRTPKALEHQFSNGLLRFQLSMIATMASA